MTAGLVHHLPKYNNTHDSLMLLLDVTFQTHSVLYFKVMLNLKGQQFWWFREKVKANAHTENILLHLLTMKIKHNLQQEQ